MSPLPRLLIQLHPKQPSHPEMDLVDEEERRASMFVSRNLMMLISKLRSASLDSR